MNFSRFVNILKILVFSKKQFIFPKKREVLILDNVGSEKIKKTFLGNI